MKKKRMSLFMGMTGILLIVLAIVTGDRLSDIMNGTLIGIGAGLAGLGISRWCFSHWSEKEPAKWKQYEIETKDERNAVIRIRAKAAAGEILQWIVLAAAWVALLLNAPLWVILSAVGIFLFKTILEICFLARYQKEM